MVTNTMMVAAFLGAAALFLVPQAKGQTPVLPESLHIESLRSAMEWGMTNSQTMKRFITVLTWENQNGPTYSVVPHDTDKLSGYNEYVDYVVRSAIMMRNAIAAKTNEVFLSDINLYVGMSTYTVFEDPNPDLGFGYLIDVGSIDSITEVAIRSIATFPSNVSAQVCMPVEGLRFFSINADTAPPSTVNGPLSSYSYVWNNGTNDYNRVILKKNSSTMYYKESTRTNMVVLNDWCFGSTNRIRVKMTVDGTMNRASDTYTQFGDPIRPVQLAITPGNLVVNRSRGADVVIQSGSDLNDWTDSLTIFGTNGFQTSFPIDTSLPSMFYRVRINQ